MEWRANFFVFIGGGLGSLLVAYGLLLLCVQQVRAMPVWVRPVKRALFVAVLGAAAAMGLLLARVLESPHFGWVGLIFVPVLLRVGILGVECRIRESLEFSSLPFFHALLGFLRAGFAVPHAWMRALEAAPGPFTEWLRHRLSRREKGETLVAAFGRIQRTLPPGEARLALETIGTLYSEGLGVMDLLQKQVAWMTRQQSRLRKIRALQASLFFQALFAGGLPWLVLTFSVWAGPETYSWAELSDSVPWKVGLVVLTLWQGLGVLFLARLGRFF